MTQQEINRYNYYVNKFANQKIDGPILEDKAFCEYYCLNPDVFSRKLWIKNSLPFTRNPDRAAEYNSLINEKILHGESESVKGRLYYFRSRNFRKTVRVENREILKAKQERWDEFKKEIFKDETNG